MHLCCYISWRYYDFEGQLTLNWSWERYSCFFVCSFFPFSLVLGVCTSSSCKCPGRNNKSTYPFYSYFTKIPNCAMHYWIKVCVDAADAIVLVASLHTASCNKALKEVFIFLKTAIVALDRIWHYKTKLCGKKLCTHLKLILKIYIGTPTYLLGNISEILYGHCMKSHVENNSKIQKMIN